MVRVETDKNKRANFRSRSSGCDGPSNLRILDRFSIDISIGSRSHATGYGKGRRRWWKKNGIVGRKTATPLDVWMARMLTWIGHWRGSRCGPHAARRQLLREASPRPGPRGQGQGPARPLPGQALWQEVQRQAYVNDAQSGTVTRRVTMTTTTTTKSLDIVTDLLSSHHPGCRRPDPHRLRPAILLPPAYVPFAPYSRRTDNDISHDMARILTIPHFTGHNKNNAH